MQKPIEPGCLVVVLRGEVANQVGVAVEFIPAGQSFTIHPDGALDSEQLARFKGGGWEVDFASDAELAWTIPAKDLMCIDGGDATTHETEQEERYDAPAHA
ncbi:MULTISPECIES: hypothetical protein [unclassified Halomonas]|uniref:hypothetical protein n=1 Tax=unclassified Halomonas TaxID=2609666 RepID=UPI0020766E4D|nr:MULTISPECIES: hypothetical protein [unclassified Halomonas]